MRRGWTNWTPLLALGLGVLGYFATREAIVGLLVAAAAFWLLRSRTPPGTPVRPSASTSSPSVPPRPERPTGMYVVCKRVTAERQEWVSAKTGRVFEVLSQNGPPGAKPGDRGEVVVSGQSHRIAARQGVSQG